ncbi:inosine/xanthosine triphosphatase [Candidatus Geothermarchaeota archaeon]|nr:MAG: inosine/xanthosine triphosphatase [Candidatus Geothermarchaeota archaeon]
MIIAVGSRNPCKVIAVKRVFEKFYREVLVKSVPVKPSVPPQPLSLLETIKGAVERGYKAILRIKGATYGIGIEAGLMRIPYTISGYFDFQLCAIIDKDMKVTIGSSSAFEFPPEVINKLIRNEATESEELFEKLTGIRNIGDKTGAVGFLTRGLVDREKLSEQSIISALIPRLNSDIYGEKWPKVNDILSSL